MAGAQISPPRMELEQLAARTPPWRAQEYFAIEALEAPWIELHAAARHPTPYGAKLARLGRAGALRAARHYLATKEANTRISAYPHRRNASGTQK